LPVQADISKVGDINRLFSIVKESFGALDIFVSNARPEIEYFYQPVLDISLEKWQIAFDSRPRAFLIGAREAAKVMGDGGRIVGATYAPGGESAALGRDGFGKGRDGNAWPLPCLCIGPAWMILPESPYRQSACLHQDGLSGAPHWRGRERLQKRWWCKAGS
jgi:NAD(P)-dependent dehydrogenase (short-subunit alcohol dehydrogenase family)